eukprot:TRINITY_DN46244_c0_g1_i1.p1 TRINITY_DN46244_c0_g1~~TRINITY_DN46244_c0_g1_i1.p1  ORF type:complete len:118 (+),score=43.55 TRINITY_DN46244_c0_g1_i1:56-409(+)
MRFELDFVVVCVFFFFFFKQKTAYEMLRSLVGSEMCIRDRLQDAVKERGGAPRGAAALDAQLLQGGDVEQARPRVVNVSAESTGREGVASERRVLTDMRKATDRTQNLPYLYRCPAL